MTEQRELTLTRTFDAPKQLVWDAYTEPAQLAKWWGPEHFHSPEDKIKVDLQVGGDYSITMVDPEGNEYPSEMTFQEIDPIDRLVFGWDDQRMIPGGTITVTLTEEAGKTKLVQHYIGGADENLFPMMEQGTNEQLDKLVALLEG